MDLWVQNIKTKECWKTTKEEADKLCQLEDIGMYRFYPICPKDAPTMEIPEQDFQQMNIYDFEVRECGTCRLAIKRSQFDKDLIGKWAYGYKCSLTDNYMQVSMSCDKWERKEQ